MSEIPALEALGRDLGAALRRELPGVRRTGGPSVTRWIPPRLVLALALVATAAGGVVAVATSRDDDRDPAPPAATRDVPGIVALARPVEPIDLGRAPRWAIEMRITAPDGREGGLAAFRRTRRSGGRLVHERCAIGGSERDLRRTRKPFGNCWDEASPEPWSITTGASSEGPVSISGVVAPRVRRLTIAGPGGTFVVPRSRTGAFLVVYGRRATGRAVLTAQLADGTTRFFRIEVPPSQRPPGVAVAQDPGGLPAWYVAGFRQDRGPRSGQTCFAVGQDSAIREHGARAGGTRLPLVCGDLGHAPVIARTVRLAPDHPPGILGPGRFAPRRTILAGAVTGAARSVAVTGPAGRRQLALSDAGRAFVAVFAADVPPAALTLEVTLADGTVQRYVNPVAVNGATAERPPPQIAGKMTARITPTWVTRAPRHADAPGDQLHREVPPHDRPDAAHHREDVRRPLRPQGGRTAAPSRSHRAQRHPDLHRGRLLADRVARQAEMRPVAAPGWCR
jgi:hypothetical protein